ARALLLHLRATAECATMPGMSTSPTRPQRYSPPPLPLKTHGGKGPIARWIVGLMPRHRRYVEPFAGGEGTKVAGTSRLYSHGQRISFTVNGAGFRRHY